MTLHPDRTALAKKSEKMAVIGEMTRGVAHEFNNIFQGVVGSLELTRKLVARGEAAESERFLTAAIASARRGASLTQRLLDCAHPDASSQQSVDVRALLQSLEPLMRALLPPGMRLEIMPCAEGTMVRCEVNEFEVAILALVINAIHAGPGGGIVIVRVDGDTPSYLRIGFSQSTPCERTQPDDHPLLSLIERFARHAGGTLIVSNDGGATTIQLPRE